MAPAAMILVRAMLFSARDAKFLAAGKCRHSWSDFSSWASGAMAPASMIKSWLPAAEAREESVIAATCCTKASS